MSKFPQNNNNKISLNIKGRASALLPNPTNLLNRRRQIKSKTIKNELPDTLINPSSSIKQPEKLFNIRKNKIVHLPALLRPSKTNKTFINIFVSNRERSLKELVFCKTSLIFE